MKRLLKTLVVLLVLAAPAYYFLVVHSPSAGKDFPLDTAELRRLANSISGAKPTEVRYEQVLSLKFSQAMTEAGAHWEEWLMPVYSYQLVYPDKTLIVDTAMSQAIEEAGAPPPMRGSYDETAYARMLEAMEQASQIVITHEHMDHIGGIAAHPKLAEILPAVRLTAEQVSHPEKMKPAVLPADVMKDYQPLQYDRVLAIAPGVVLLKSPGHTPGSQMVFVQLADGRELLFLGDVSWRTQNIVDVRERPLFMTLVIGEDRSAVIGEFQALHQLMQSEPAIKLVPGHDGPAIGALADAGYLRKGFR
jgi:glyoxylase-like metal-dependent hydrolase (beta-lactamase superfamily II)